MKDNKKQRPPSFAEWLLNKMTYYQDEFSSADNFLENYDRILDSKGKIKADFWYWSQVISSMLYYFNFRLIWIATMLKNYMKITLRDFKRNKAYSVINVSGIAAGMACCILILLFIQDELSYDQYHKNKKRIYRITFGEEMGGNHDHYAGVPYGAVSAFVEKLPEIKSCARIGKGTGIIKTGEGEFEADGIIYTDSTFFSIFTHEFTAGDPSNALQNPGTIVISEEYASRLFKNTNPIGKTLNLDSEGDLIITGIIKNVPRNSHFRFNFAVNNSGLRKRNRGSFLSWNGIIGWAYILVEKGTNPVVLEDKFLEIEREKIGEREKGAVKVRYILQKITDIHLHSHLQYEIENNSDIIYIYIFSLVAVFILLIACLNFINLSTARSAKRGREVGLRKVFGAYKKSLVYQFLTESLLFSILGFLFAVVIVVMTLPVFNNITGKEIEISSINYFIFSLFLAGLIFFTGLLAGGYPAFFLSSFRPAAILKQNFGLVFRSSNFRKYLVVLQFVVSIFLIASTFIIMDQLEFLKNRKLGFDKDQILVIRLKRGILENHGAFKNELLNNTNILAASYSYDILGRGRDVITYRGGIDPEGLHAMNTFYTDFDFVKTYGLKILSGRDFSRKIKTDPGSYLINETGAAKLGPHNEAVGKKIFFKGRYEGTIIGIIKDFNFKSLRENIESFVILCSNSAGGSHRERFLSLKINTKNIESTLAFIKLKWKNFEKDRNIDYFFLDDYYNSLYKSEQNFSTISSIFTFLAIFIACLGLFGLVAFTAERRTKEIGIRKALGATVFRIILLLTKEFTFLIIIANIFALPLSYILMKIYWLQDFAYKINPDLIKFVLAAVISLLIALLTVSYQSIKAAKANPIDTLRYE